MISNTQKLYITVIIAIIFIIVSSPFVYRLTNKVGLHTCDSNGCPTLLGLSIHTVVFAVLVYVFLYFVIKKTDKDGGY